MSFSNNGNSSYFCISNLTTQFTNQTYNIKTEGTSRIEEVNLTNEDICELDCGNCWDFDNTCGCTWTNCQDIGFGYPVIPQIDFSLSLDLTLIIILESNTRLNSESIGGPFRTALPPVPPVDSSGNPIPPGIYFQINEGYYTIKTEEEEVVDLVEEGFTVIPFPAMVDTSGNLTGTFFTTFKTDIITSSEPTQVNGFSYDIKIQFIFEQYCTDADCNTIGSSTSTDSWLKLQAFFEITANDSLGGSGYTRSTTTVSRITECVFLG